MVVWRVQKYTHRIRLLRRRCVRLEYLYRMQEHRKEYRKLTSSNLRSQYMNDGQPMAEHEAEKESEESGEDNGQSPRLLEEEEEEDEEEEEEEEQEQEQEQEEKKAENVEKKTKKRTSMEAQMQTQIEMQIQPTRTETKAEAEVEIDTEKATSQPENVVDMALIPKTNGHEDDMFTPAMQVKMDDGVMRPTWSDSPRAQRSLPMRQQSVNVNDWYNHFKYESEPDLMVKFTANDLFQEPAMESTPAADATAQTEEQETNKLKEPAKSDVAHSSLLSIKKPKKQKEIDNEKLMKEIHRIENRIIALKLKKHGFSILVAALSFICGLSLYDAANESFHRALPNSLVGREVGLLIFGLITSTLAVTCILYLDKMTTGFVSFLKKITKLEKSKPSEEEKNNGNDNNNNNNNDNDKDKENDDMEEAFGNEMRNRSWISTALPVCRCCSRFYRIQYEESIMASWSRRQLKKKRREQIQNIELTLLFGRYITNVISLITAISYVAFVESLFKLIFTSNGEVWSSWIFFALHLGIAITVSTTLAKFEPKKKK
ncbi:hypothetical protein RFI_16710 [Reticulomyxa filosa]|uniref:Uncharacterized protein n=1 Tax=Reticulomyxa filosa TaxID=46433 RepID=X6N5C1_RETFI|nr:hypothetical protein RFI_16710 [Reticulomyxa filosa]|eukprot:ETO20507.1 hypothetical protein RFI_16710 [Reticulomyxa filosa]